MSFNISDFGQNIVKYGVQRPNEFEVTITLPNALQNAASEYPFISQFQTIMPFRASSCSPPGFIFQTNETHKLGIGPRIKQPYNVVFPELKIEFIADAQSVIEQAINLWGNLAFNFTFTGTNFATYYSGYRNDIISPDIMIRKFNRGGGKISDYHVYDALPLVFTGQQFSWDETNSLIKFTLALHYISYSITTYSQ
jgi:hypothetical protein